MQRTEKLNLPVLENTDSITNIYTQANDISETLENEIGGYLDDLEDLPEIRTSIAELGNDIANVSARTTANETAIGINSNKITAIENGKGFYVTENGERIEGTITRYVISASSTGSRGELTLNESSTDRDIIVSLNGHVMLNLTELIGLTSMGNKKLINAICDVPTFDTNRGGMPAFSLEGIYKPPYQNYYVISFSADKTTIAHQTYFPATSSWIPSVAGNYQDIDVVVTFELFEEISE